VIARAKTARMTRGSGCTLAGAIAVACSATTARAMSFEAPTSIDTAIDATVPGADVWSTDAVIGGDDPSFTCPCGTHCAVHNDKTGMPWHQCDT